MVDVDIRVQDTGVHLGDRIIRALETGPKRLATLQEATGIEYHTLDTTVRRMVKRGTARRVAWGVYAIDADPFSDTYSDTMESILQKDIDPLSVYVRPNCPSVRDVNLKVAKMADIVSEIGVRIEALCVRIGDLIGGFSDTSDTHIQARFKNTLSGGYGGKSSDMSENTVGHWFNGVGG